MAVALEDAEDNRLAISATTAFALDAPCAGETLIDLDDAEQRAPGFAGLEDPLAQTAIDTVHRIAVQAAQLRRMVRRLVRRLEGAQVCGEYRTASRILAAEILERSAYLLFIAVLGFTPLFKTLN